jgi:hypothetical protein
MFRSEHYNLNQLFHGCPTSIGENKSRTIPTAILGMECNFIVNVTNRPDDNANGYRTDVSVYAGNGRELLSQFTGVDFNNAELYFRLSMDRNNEVVPTPVLESVA